MFSNLLYSPRRPQITSTPDSVSATSAITGLREMVAVISVCVKVMLDFHLDKGIVLKHLLIFYDYVYFTCIYRSAHTIPMKPEELKFLKFVSCLRSPLQELPVTLLRSLLPAWCTELCFSPSPLILNRTVWFFRNCLHLLLI